MSLLAATTTTAPLQVAQTIAFGIIAAMMIVSAVKVVTTKNVVHAALYLVMVLAGAAAQFILLAAEFVAVTQVLVYIGAIVVLFLFGVMLTRAPIEGEVETSRKNWYGGAVIAVSMAGLLAYVLIDGFRAQRLPQEPIKGSAAVISDAIFGRYLLPFEVVSVLLTAALIGAIVIARKD